MKGSLPLHGSCDNTSVLQTEKTPPAQHLESCRHTLEIQDCGEYRAHQGACPKPIELEDRAGPMNPNSKDHPRVVATARRPATLQELQTYLEDCARRTI